MQWHMKHASVQITAGSISQARNIFSYPEIVRALSTRGLAILDGNRELDLSTRHWSHEGSSNVYISRHRQPTRA